MLPPAKCPMRCVAPGDPVLSNPTETTARETMLVVVTSLADNLGFTNLSSNSLEEITDLAVRFLEKYCTHLHTITEHAGRSRSVLADVELLFHYKLEVNIEDLLIYMEEVGPIVVDGLQLPRLTPADPLPIVGIGRDLQLVSPPPGMELLLERPDHVPDWAPPILTGEMTQEAFEERFPTTTITGDQPKKEVTEKKIVELPDFSEETVESLGLQDYANNRLLIENEPSVSRPAWEDVESPPPSPVEEASNSIEEVVVLEESDKEHSIQPEYEIEPIDAQQWESSGKGLTKSGRATTSQFAKTLTQKLPVMILKRIKSDISSTPEIRPQSATSEDSPVIEDSSSPIDSETPTSSASFFGEKRRRGRPPKRFVEEDLVTELIPTVTQSSPMPPPQPKAEETPPSATKKSASKTPKKDESSPKRGRGRPPKPVRGGHRGRGALSTPILSSSRRAVSRPLRYLDGWDGADTSFPIVKESVPKDVPKDPSFPSLTISISRASLIASAKEKEEAEVVEIPAEIEDAPLNVDPVGNAPGSPRAPIRLKISIRGNTSENLEETAPEDNEDKRKHKKDKKRKKEKRRKRERHHLENMADGGVEVNAETDAEAGAGTITAAEEDTVAMSEYEADLDSSALSEAIPEADTSGVLESASVTEGGTNVLPEYATEAEVDPTVMSASLVNSDVNTEVHAVSATDDAFNALVTPGDEAKPPEDPMDVDAE